MEQAYAQFKEHCPEINCIKQENAMDEQQKAAFLAQFVPGPSQTLLGFAVMGGVFGEGVDLTGDRLIGVGIVGPGLPQVRPRQEQLRDYFEQTRGSGFDYAYRYPGMNKVLQAAGRVIRTPRDKGVVLLIDNRFAMPDYRRLMPPHWSHLKMIYDTESWNGNSGGFGKNKNKTAPQSLPCTSSYLTVCATNCGAVFALLFRRWIISGCWPTRQA